MTEKQDIRWIQRFSKYKKVLSQLSKFNEKDELNELAWNTIRDFYKFQGEESIQGSRDAFRMAFRRELISNGEIWMDMIESRIQTVHSYNEDTADKIADEVRETYNFEFLKLKDAFETIIAEQARQDNQGEQ